MKSLLQKATCPAMEFIYAASMYDLDYEDVAVIDIEFSTQDDVCHGLSILILKFIESTNSLYIGTIHSAKGLEYDNVIVYNVDSNTFPLNCEDNWNLYYVGVTRAKNNLCVLDIGIGFKISSSFGKTFNIALTLICPFSS